MISVVSNAIKEISKKQELECKIYTHETTSNPNTLENVQNIFEVFGSIIEAVECINKNIANKDPIELKPYAKNLGIINDQSTLQNLSVEMVSQISFPILTEHVSFNEIDALYKKFPNTTYLFVQIAQGIINELFKKDIVQMTAVMEIVESYKSEKLLSSYHLKPEIKRPSNPSLSRFGLVPATGIMTVSEILERAATDLQIKTGAKNFKDLVGLGDCGVIILYKIISDPIEIRSHQLLFPNNPQEKPVVEDSHPGISKELVQKYDTIIELNKPKSKIWDFSGEILDKKSTKKYIVVETLDGHKFRVLAPWINAKMGGIVLGKFRVKKLIEVLQETKIQPTRSSAYNRNIGHAFAKNMFLKKPIDLDTYGKFSDLPSHKLLQDASQKILIRMSKNWGRTKKLSKFELNDLFHDQEYAQIFKKAIMSNYADICTDSVANTTKNIFGEIFTSFLVEMERNSIKLLKELHDAYLKLPMELDKQECDDIFVKILTMIIKPYDNIYAALEYKNYLFSMLSLTNIKKAKSKEQADGFFEL